MVFPPNSFGDSRSSMSQACRAYFDPPKCTSVLYEGRGSLKLFYDVTFWCAGSCPEEGEVCPPTKQDFAGAWPLPVDVNAAKVADLMDFTNAIVAACWDTEVTGGRGSAFDRWIAFRDCVKGKGMDLCDALNPDAIKSAMDGIHKLNGEWGAANCNCGQIAPIPAGQVIRGLYRPNYGI